MSGDRDTYKYQFIGPDHRIKHSGITNDLNRRESELRREYGEGTIRQVGHRTTREAAREWANSHLEHLLSSRPAIRAQYFEGND